MEPPYRIQLEENAILVIYAPRKIPVSLRSKVRKELDEMEADGVIEKVEEPTEWVNSLVVVENPDGSLRLCLDPRDLNKAIKREHFQLPTFEDISTRLAGATHFTKLDAKKGYWQIPLDKESTKLTTMNTPFGRYKFLRLPFGIHSAQEVFHRIINGNFIDIKGVETDIDDFLVWGKNIEDHNRTLISSLERAKKIGLTMNLDKCKFNADELVYLGYKISAKGIELHDAKVKAIMEMLEPTNKKGVQRILGLINYVAKFTPKLSQVTNPLRELLQKDIH